MATRNRDGSGRHDSSVATSKCSKQSKRLTGFSFNTDPDNRQRSVSLAAGGLLEDREPVLRGTYRLAAAAVRFTQRRAEYQSTVHRDPNQALHAHAVAPGLTKAVR